MPGESKARSFVLAAFRPPFESMLYGLALTLPAAAALLATLDKSYFAPPLVAVGCSIGLWLNWLSSIRSTLTMGVDGFSVCRRAKERFVPWTDFVRFEKGPRGIVTLTSNGWVSLGRAHVISDKAMMQRDREYGMGETLKQLEEAAKQWRQQRAKPRTLQLLEGHDERQWSTILEKAAQSDFRTSGITQSHLRDDLLNPETPPALRELLAKTLKVRIEEDVVEDTIEAFASERSKKALRSLLEKES
ncbi:MAG: hypothetical protein ACI9KE_003354 [Polyangiales bacterium]